jgi:hypothetical protein
VTPRPASRLIFFSLFVVALTAGSALAQSDEVAERIMASADRYVERGEYDAALGQLEELLTRFPDTVWVQDALLRMAELHLMMGQTDQAMEVADRVATEYPGTPAGAGADVIAAEILLDSSVTPDELAATRDRLERVPTVYPAEVFPDLPWRARALVRLGELDARAGEDDAAAGAFLRVLEQEPLSDWTPRAAVGLGEAFLRRGDWVAAIDILQSVIDRSDTLGGSAIPESLVVRAWASLSLGYRFFVAPEAGMARWTSTNALSVTGTSLDRPTGIALGPGGSMIIVDERTPIVGVLDATGQFQGGLPLTGALLPFWGADGTPYSVSERSIVRILTRDRVTFVADGDEVKDLRAGFVDLSGNWFILDTDDDRITSHSIARQYRETVFKMRNRKPYDLHGLGNGDLYVLDRDQDDVLLRVAGDTEWRTVVDGDWDRPVALTVDRLGNVYVLDERTSQIHVYDPQGTRVQTLGPTLPGGVQLKQPRDLSVDSAGRIFVADRDGGNIWIVQ